MSKQKLMRTCLHIVANNGINISLLPEEQDAIGISLEDKHGNRYYPQQWELVEAAIEWISQNIIYV